MSETKRCFRCNVEITSRYGKKFCSNRCAALHATVFAAAATTIDKSRICDECGIVFQRKDPKSKFCSHSCAAKCSNRKRFPDQKRACPDCPASTKNGDKRTYIRTACTWECKRQKRINDWLNGKVDFVTAHGVSRIVRDWFLEKYDRKCQDCGYGRERKDGSSILHLHHLDGFWKNTAFENLRLLCPNCHALTENYGALNMGNGRKWKTQYRYAGLAER